MDSQMDRHMSAPHYYSYGNGYIAKMWLTMQDGNTGTYHNNPRSYRYMMVSFHVSTLAANLCIIAFHAVNL